MTKSIAKKRKEKRRKEIAKRKDQKMKKLQKQPATRDIRDSQANKEISKNVGHNGAKNGSQKDPVTASDIKRYNNDNGTQQGESRFLEVTFGSHDICGETREVVIFNSSEGPAQSNGEVQQPNSKVKKKKKKPKRQKDAGKVVKQKTKVRTQICKRSLLHEVARGDMAWPTHSGIF